MSSWAQFFATIGASTVTLASVGLLAAALAHLSLRWWIKRRGRQDASGVESSASSQPGIRQWATLGLKEIRIGRGVDASRL